MLDLIFIFFILLISEKIILREKYILLSPFTLVTISFGFIYILPLILYTYNIDGNLISGASHEGINMLLIYSRIFLYSWSLFSFFCFSVIRKKKLIYSPVNNMFSRDFFIVSTIILVIIIFSLTFASVGFNPTDFINKLVDPRNNTHFKEGLGPITFAIDIAKKLLVFISIINITRNRNFLSLVHLILAISISILGGAKTDIIILVLFFTLIYQKFNRTKIRITFMRILKISILFISVTVVSFLIMSQTRETLNTVFYSILDYPQEAFYSSKVIIDFTPEWHYWKDSLESLIFTPIPRAIFENKSYYDFFNLYWRPLYQPNTVIFHTSTYGFFSEGHMLLGMLSPFVYAILFSILSFKLFINFYKHSKMESIFVNMIIISQVYFILRIGAFEASFIWYLIICYVVSILFFSNKVFKKIKFIQLKQI